MKFRLTILLLVTSLFSGFAQTTNNCINVSDNIKLIKLSSNTYLHLSVSEMKGFGRVYSNGIILVNKGEAFLLDSPVTNEQTEKLINFISDSLHTEVIGFIPNHWHNDCMGGLQYIHKRGITSYANQLTINIAKEKRLPVPKMGFKESLALQLDSIKIECYYLGGGHTIDNIVIWIPSQKILFAGCMVKCINSKSLGNLADADIKAWPATIQKVMNKFPNAKIVIPGHGMVGGIELLVHTNKLLAEFINK